MSSTLDLVGFSGQRKFTQLPSGFTRSEFTTAMVEGLLSVGWEIVTGPTAQSQGDGYVIRSQQAPWYDPENIPAWYLGNRVRLTIDNSNVNDIQFSIAADYADSEVEPMASPMIQRLSNMAGFGYNMLFCPYQLVTWSDRHPSEIANSARYSGILICVLNLPKFVQQRNRVVHSVFASSVNRSDGSLGSGSGGTNGRVHYIYQEKGEGALSSNSGSNYFTLLSGGVSRNNRTGRRIWDVDNDSSMGDSTKWSPFFLPARILYPTPGSSTVRIQGFLWDALVINEGYSLNSVIRFDTQFGVSVNFICHSGRSLVSHTTLDGTLWFCITENVTV